MAHSSCKSEGIVVDLHIFTQVSIVWLETRSLFFGFQLLIQKGMNGGWYISSVGPTLYRDGSEADLAVVIVSSLFICCQEIYWCWNITTKTKGDSAWSFDTPFWNSHINMTYLIVCLLKASEKNPSSNVHLFSCYPFPGCPLKGLHHMECDLNHEAICALFLQHFTKKFRKYFKNWKRIRKTIRGIWYSK